MLNNYISEQSVMKMKNAQCKEKTFETSSCYLELTITCNAKRQKDAYYIMSTLILCTWRINVLNRERQMLCEATCTTYYQYILLDNLF